MPTTQEVLDHHLECFASGDLEGILSDYTAESIMFTPKGKMKGVDAIKPMFEAMFVEFAKPGASFEMQEMSVEGDYAYIFWTAESADKVYEVGTDTFVIQNGKIVAQSFAGKITPKA